MRRHYRKTVRLREAPTVNPVFKELLPPDENGRPISTLTRWRLAVFAAIVVLGLAVMSGFGAFSWLGLDGFARAGDLKKQVESVTSDLAGVKSDVRDLRLSQLEQAFYEAKRLMCVANSNESERFYEGQISKMHRQYFELSHGITLPVPNCDKVKS
jgi:hypothetical protein